MCWLLLLSVFADAKLKDLGLSSEAIRQQLYANSRSSTTSSKAPTSAAADSPSSSPPPGSSKQPATTTAQRSDVDSTVSISSPTTTNSESDYTALQTQGFSAQESAAGAAAKARCLQVLSGFWQPLLNLVQATPTASLVEHGVYTRPAASMNPDSFGKGRVVIIGDAAHPLRPTGQGSNQTLEDAWGLGKVLQESCAGSCGGGRESISSKDGSVLLLERLDVFRQQRAERLAPIMAYTTATGNAAYTRKQATSSSSGGDDAEKAKAEAVAAMGGDTPTMTAEQFSEFCCRVDFERLSVAA